ncbi:Retrovirus-related Pol polyprotein from type-2 retrotransposable element R2DM [Sesamum angolense]|uniref:Retrovirus-related Pol polyprotein from type-2 retrotransposable element R2DM n=1 Tax=Sesamum angolense TaxID=2727404 RepID=A0AAE1T917_9LAMI|nr:Retrovirus-related Pol polyprotein from type-2 retrotransposable element R2DM [Sesamum angolense]
MVVSWTTNCVAKVGTGHGVKKLKHTEVSVWIKLRHLPIELCTTEGLSTMASGIGRPLYPDAITRACTRLDFARVCIMINVSSKLPNHVVIMMPKELGGESACKVDVEKPPPPAPAAPELKFSEQGQVVLVPEEIHPETETDRTARQGVLINATPQMFPHVEHSDMECEGPEQEGTTKLQFEILSANSGYTLSLYWKLGLCNLMSHVSNQEFYLDGDGLLIMRDRTILITVVYGANEVSARRELWQGLIKLAVIVGNVPWLVGGDFNAVLDMSEVSGASGDIRVAMNEFNDCILQTGLLSLPMQGERFTWHNCSFGWPEPLEERLDRLLVNDVWMDRWPNLFYTCLTPRTSDHSPLVLKGDCRNMQAGLYLKASKLEQVMLRQRAKLQWLKGGDQCSKGLLVGDRTDRAIDLRYLRPWARHILMDDKARAIIRPVTIDEVKTAFFDIEEDKAPGPDGFSSGFFKAAWPVVGEEVSKAIIDFFKTGRLLKQLNATLLTLIPKVRTPHSVAEFRPISCCNVVYKVISKILVSRIREILDLLISPSQNAIVPGRLISDNILLAQELFSGWIEDCVTSAHYSVVMNGGVHGFFAGARGLRQGDPMSPYLFVLVMEVLHMILQQLIEQDGEFQYHWRCKDLNLFQLSFADDLLLFCKADVHSLLGLRDSLLATLGFQRSSSGQIPWSTHSFQHGFLLQIVNHYFRRLTAALKSSNRIRLLFGLIGSSVRLRDCSIWTVKDNKGAWGWRKMLSLRHSLVSQIHFALEMETPFHFGMIHGTHLDLSFLVSPGTPVNQYWTSRQAFSGY